MHRDRWLLHHYESRPLQVLQQVVRGQGRHEVAGSAEAALADMRQRVREAEKHLGGVGGGEGLVGHPSMLRRERMGNKGGGAYGRMRWFQNASASSNTPKSGNC